MSSTENGGDATAGQKTRSGLKLRITNVRPKAAGPPTPAGTMNVEADPPVVPTQSATQVGPQIVELEASETDSVASIQVQVAKRGRGRPKKAEQTEGIDKTNSSEFMPTAPRKRPGEEVVDRAPKVRRFITSDTDNSASIIPTELFKTLGYVAPTPPPPSGRGRSTPKQLEADPLGPFSITNNTTWIEFISKVAKALECHPDQAVTSTMYWKFLKPKNSLFLPVKDEEGFSGMLAQILKKNSDKEFVVKITKAEHAPANGTMGGRSFGVPPGPSDTPPALLHQGSTVFDGTYDQKLFAIEAELKAEYPVGKCPKHPDLRCFHHKPSDLHFELTPACLSIWAAAINRNQVDKLSIPPSKQFKKETSLDYVDPKATRGESQVPGIQQANPGESQMTQMMGMTLAMLARTVSSLPGLSSAASPERRHEHTMTSAPRWETFSSPPPPYQGTVHEWGANNNLTVETCNILDSWGFQPGDHLHEYVTSNMDDVKSSGIKPMELQRAIRASRLYNLRAKERAD